MKSFDVLPPVMQKRAQWARERIIGKVLDEPNIQIDEDELLAWVFNENDGLWYSVDGNYSSSSPQEKMDKRRKYLKSIDDLEKKYAKQNIKRMADTDYWSDIRQKVLKRDNNVCQRCGKKIGKFHVHHILPRKKGGTDHYDNLITVCASCHKKVEGIDYK